MSSTCLIIQSPGVRGLRVSVFQSRYATRICIENIFVFALKTANLVGDNATFVGMAISLASTRTSATAL